MLKEKKQHVLRTEMITYPPLKKTSVHPKEEHEVEVRADALKPARRRSEIDLQVVTKLIEYLEKKP